MNIESFSSALTEVPMRLELVAEASKPEWSQRFNSIDDLDKPIFVTQENRGDLPRVTEETRERLDIAGYGGTVIDAIGSEAEANIYLDAPLESQEVNGKETLIRTDIDYEKTDEFGETNRERMTKGRAPLDAQNRPIELHHIGQKSDSPLAELTGTEHCGGGNDNVLHNKLKESEVDRGGFKKERADHWKTRAAQLDNDA